jgi:hypothetical protein
MVIHWGYLVETAIYAVFSLLFISLASIQILYNWRKPHNADRIMIIQKYYHPTGLAFGILGSLWVVDHRAVYGIYSPDVVLFLTVAFSWTKVLESVIWFKQFLEISVNLKAYSGVPKFDEQTCWILSIANVVISIAACIVCVVVDRVWPIGIVILYLCLVMGMLLGITAMGWRVITKSQEDTDVNRVQNVISKEERMRVRQKLFQCLIFLTLVFLLLLALAVKILASQDMTVVEQLSTPDPAVYTFNVNLSIVGLMFLMLGTDAFRVSWLPLKNTAANGAGKVTNKSMTGRKPSSGGNQQEVEVQVVQAPVPLAENLEPL